ncbi:MAG: molybdopterin-dependent oxidoreductase [Deltaproteobacteria bacterium]|nr:molybdopterin-dependent oxidoreductase [Deltaproteobacteria bacterium]
MTWKRVGYTSCTLDCPDTCSLMLLEDERGNLRIAGDPEHPFTLGFTCAKSSGFLRRLRSSSRIREPLLRRKNTWRPVSWDNALDLCAEKIQHFRREPASILHYHGEAAKGVLQQAARLFFGILGSSEVRGSLCDAAGYLACVADFGSRKNHDVSDLLNAAQIVNWGKDLTRSSVHTAAIVAQARRQGARVLTISPGGDGHESHTDLFVRIRPGMDRFLAAGAIKVLNERDGIEGELLQRTQGWDAFRQAIAGYSLERLASLCDVSPAMFEVIADYYRAPGPTATLIAAGVQRYLHGGENVRYINALALLSGNIGRPGGGTYFHLHSKRNFNLGWIKPPEWKPRRSLLMPTIGQDILDAKDPPIRMIWVNGSNFVNQAPESALTVRALEKLEFRVVVDAFMTDTAEQADLVLPCTLMLEQEDLVGSYLHPFVHYAGQVQKPPEGARSDYWILSQIGQRLNPPVILPSPEECFRASLRSSTLETTLEALREKRFVRSNEPPVVYEGLQFDHPDGKYRFPASLHEEPPPPEDFPYRFLTLIRGESVHSQILPEDQGGPPTVWVAPEHPGLADLDLKKEIFLASPLGRMLVKVKLLKGLHPEAVLYRRGDWMKCGGGANRLIPAAVTDLGRCAPFYQAYVKLTNG